MNTNFPLNIRILLYDLKIKYLPSEVYQTGPAFSKYCLWEEGMSVFTTTLLVGRLRDILSAAKKNPSNYFVGLMSEKENQGGYLSEMIQKERLNNVIVLETEQSLAKVFNQMLDIYRKYQNWNTRMLVSTMTQQGFQALLDISEEMIGNHIDIIDAAYNLQAYTRNIDIDDEITEELLENGRHTSNTMDKFIEHRRFEQFERNDGIVISDDFKLCKYVTLKRFFHQNGQSVIHVIMHCNHREADRSLLDLFQILLDHIEYYVNKNAFHPSGFLASQQYLRDLLEGRIATVDEAISKSSYATIPFQQRYQLYLVSFDDHFNTPVEKLAEDMNNYLPTAYVLTYRRRIAILQSLDDIKKDEVDLREKLGKYLEPFTCIIGISNPVDNLWDIRVALEQAGCAIEYGAHKQRDSKDDNQGVSFYDFEQAVLTLLVAKSYNAAPALFKQSMMFQAIQNLREYDRQHGSSLYQTLQTYLNCNRRATETSELLHMHRNTVLYHIDRIQQLLGVNLDDAEESTKLYLVVQIYETNMIEVLL